MSRWLILFIIFICAGCSSFRLGAHEPGWINGPPVFVKGGYVYSVGCGSGEDLFVQREAATDSAKVNIRRFLGKGEIKLDSKYWVWHDGNGRKTYVMVRYKLLK